MAARRITQPSLWPRNPPVRFRRHTPTTWLELVLTEGRNRQVRRMTAAIGFLTRRLVRHRIGPLRLGGLAPGRWRTLDEIPAILRGRGVRPPTGVTEPGDGGPGRNLLAGNDPARLIRSTASSCSSLLSRSVPA